MHDMKTGVLKVKKDHRDYSLHRTFGTVSPTVFTECNFDAGFPIPNQDVDGFPNGCTGYAQKGIAEDEDKKQYIAKYTYDQTLAIEGIFPGNPQFEQVGCDVRDSLKSTIVYGLQAIGETATDALNHRRGAYFAVEQIAGLDWFDSIRSALQTGQRSISIATPWFPAFENAPLGIVQSPTSYDVSTATWHNHKICGWKTINGVPYLVDSSWQGIEYGDKGFAYFPREIINQLMTISGSGAFTVAPFTGQNIQNVQLTILQTIVSYLQMWLRLL